jgi:hypothetical protein
MGFKVLRAPVADRTPDHGRDGRNARRGGWPDQASVFGSNASKAEAHVVANCRGANRRCDARRDITPARVLCLLRQDSLLRLREI